MKDSAHVNRESAESISSRFRAERERLDYNQEQIADWCGVSRRTVIDWEGGSKIPADALANIWRATGGAFDVFKVLGGHAGGMAEPAMLSCDEKSLLDTFRALPEEGRRMARATLAAWLMASVGGTNVAVTVRGDGNMAAGRDVMAAKRRRKSKGDKERS